MLVGPQITIAKYCELGSSARDHYMYTCKCICKYEILADFSLAIAEADRQTTEFNSLPNFLKQQLHVHVLVMLDSGLVLTS